MSLPNFMCIGVAKSGTTTLYDILKQHPEVYIPILPAFGLISEMISKFTQCIISGRDSMLIALLITAVSGCIV